MGFFFRVSAGERGFREERMGGRVIVVVEEKDEK